ncbi:MAG: SBBP repeat-containing protein, partial [Pyrinomonadaceae bacterium]
MHRTNLKSVFAVLVVLVTAMTVLMPGLSTKRVNASRVEVTPGQLSGRSPVYFEENRGQKDGRVRYFSRGAGMEMFLTATEAVYVIRSRESKVESLESKAYPLRNRALDSRLPTRDSKAVAIYMRLAGANPGANFVPSEKLGHETNYLIGNESAWRTGVPNFGRVTAENIYNGIDMVWKGREQGGIQYDFVLAANTDANQIEWEIEGADNVSLDAEGGLVIETEAGVMKQSKPFTFQETDGVRSEVSSQWSVARNLVKGGGQKFSAKYTLGEYDRSKPLTIDPLAYSTFLGGSGFDGGEKIVVDAAGNAYLTGGTFSTAFPTTPGAFDTTLNGSADVFVSKLNAAGTALVYSTFIGGSSNDYGHGIAVDTSGNVFVTGDTNSPSFPTTAGAFDTTHNGAVDAFVAKLDPAGSSLLYSTFIGGSLDEYGYGIAVDTAGNAFVTGSSGSTAFPTTAGAFDTTFNGGFDAFVTKVNGAGSALVYSTFIGGAVSDDAYGLAVDSSGNAFVTGET